jgi:four helix bundle protein
MDVAGLLVLTVTTASALCEEVVGLEQEPLIRMRMAFQRQLGGAGVSVLAQVADANALAFGSFRDRMNAALALRRARATSAEVKDLLRAAVKRQYITETRAERAIQLADEAIALVLSATVALRGGPSVLAA